MTPDDEAAAERAAIQAENTGSLTPLACEIDFDGVRRAVPPATPAGDDDWRLLTYAELLALPEPGWIIDGMIPRESLVVVYGPPGAYKTTFCVALAASVASRRPFYGKVVSQPCRALYVACEDTTGVRTRLSAWAATAGLSEVDVLTLGRPVSILDAEQVGKFLTVATPAAPGLVVIDTYAGATGGMDENASESTTGAMLACWHIIRALHCTLVLVHHSNASATRERGHSALRAAASTMISLNAIDDTIEVDCSKQKNAEEFRRLTLRAQPPPPGVKGRTLAPISALGESGTLTPSAVKVLSVLRDSFQTCGATKTDWQRSLPDVPERTFYRVSERLLQRGFVRVQGAKHFITPAGETEVVRHG